MQYKIRSVFPSRPLKIYTVTTTGIRFPTIPPNLSHFSPTTAPNFFSALVIRATLVLLNDDDLYDARLCMSAKMVGQGCTKTGGWCVHVQEHSPAGHPQESPQLQPVQSPKE